MYRIILALSFIERNKTPLIIALIIAVLISVIVLMFMHTSNLGEIINEKDGRIADYIEESKVWEAVDLQNKDLKDDIVFLKEEIVLIKAGKEELEARNEELEIIFSEVESRYEELETRIAELETSNEYLSSTVDVLEKESEEMLARWMAQAARRPQPDVDFKITFYSTQRSYSHLIPGKTVAMNSQQVADLGLKRGGEIYVISNKGWSGFYTITDSGCAYGTIDIYIEQYRIPSYGVEYGVRILF